MIRRACVAVCAIAAIGSVCLDATSDRDRAGGQAGEGKAATGIPKFELVQPELFGVAGGQPNC